MKRIEAFIQPHCLGEIIQALHARPQFPGFTVFPARGQGHGRGPKGHYVYGEGDLGLHNRKVLLLFCEDVEASALVELIVRAAHTGNPGDGIVAVSEVTEIMRIREALPAPGEAT